MPATAVDQLYRYAFESALTEHDGGSGLRIATSGGATAHPHFFSGWLAHPVPHARAMLVVSRAARTRYHVPGTMLARRLALADPVVTADPAALRFEAFSSDCGVYARLDVDAAALDGELASEGTTNVDFNPPMREALGQVVAGGPLHLAVGEDSVAALTEHGSVVERRVPLPARWIKGFGEVQAALARMTPRLDMPGTAVRRLVRELPRTGQAQFHVRPSGRDVRLSRTAGHDGVPLAGAPRLLLLEPLVADARRLRGYAGDGGASAWVLDVDGGRLTLALSPEVWRGFSGEGGALAGLAGGDDAARGLAGYDLHTGAFFARRLPFDLDAVERLHPRLLDARRLVSEGAVRLAGDDEAFVTSGATEYHVRGERCTCPWYAKHGGERGPCKHVLAGELARDAAPTG